MSQAPATVTTPSEGGVAVTVKTMTYTDQAVHSKMGRTVAVFQDSSNLPIAVLRPEGADSEVAALLPHHQPCRSRPGRTLGTSYGSTAAPRALSTREGSEMGEGFYLNTYDLEGP